MKEKVKTILLFFAGLMAAVIVGIGVLIIIEWPHPCLLTENSWEQNFQSKVTSDYKDFQGHWVSSDIAAYIYSYIHTSHNIEDHQNKIIMALNDYEVTKRTPTLLVLRQNVTYSHPDGFNEWRFIFDERTRITTVLYANLDSEMDQHPWLVSLLMDYHDKRVNVRFNNRNP
ncbi:MAG: hypothetical protein ACW98D_21515 [Promethearchaeota archaeon]|jgi:hypothetical protein